MQRRSWGAAFYLVCALLWAGASQAVTRGQPLAQALAELRRSGLALIFSSALIGPDLKVNVDPGAGTPEDIARRILAPYGLGLQAMRENLFSVVKLPEKPPTAVATVSTAGGQTGTRPTDASSTGQPAEVDVYASRYGVAEAQLGPQPTTDISRQNLEALPGLFQDAMRAVRYLPGVATSAISVRPHIRGGREDEMATYFDGVPLFEPYHYKDIQGLLGTLDPETVSRMDFFSGVFPARYGNRLSGVLDMQPRTWDGQNYYALSQSVLFSEALTQGKLASSPLQWLGAVRVGVVDFISDLLDRNQVDPGFLDALGRVQYDLSDRMNIAGGYLLLDDNLHANLNSSVGVPIPGSSPPIEQARISYRDGTGWLGWTFSPSDDATLHAILSRTERHTHRSGMLDRAGSGMGNMDDSRHFGTTTGRVESNIRFSDRWGLVSGLEWYDYEAEYLYTSYAAYNSQLAKAFGQPLSVTRRTDLDIDGQAYASYLSALWAVTSSISVDAGVRWDGERYGVAFRGNQVSPRIGFQYKYDPATVVRASWGRLSQTQRPDELQIDDGDDVFHRAEFAMQTVIALERKLSSAVQLHVEAFDKRIEDPRPRFENLLDPISLLPELEVDRVLIRPSSARAVGTELSLRWQATPHWSGWANYSWSEATDDINGVEVPRSWDQKHAAAVGVAWRETPWLWSSDVTWHTGWARNRLYAVSVNPADFGLLPLNVRKWPAYFSLDSRVTWAHPLPKGALELFGEIDNATNHANPCCIDVQYLGGTTHPLLERTTSVWLPRFALVGATWKLP
jgi:outer membrane receptor protein involved in Fe transport